MVVRLMVLKPISQCSRYLDFQPHRAWPGVLPAVAWRGHLVCGFERLGGEAVEVDEAPLIDTLKAVYPELALSEVARFLRALERTSPEMRLEFRDSICAAYGLRWNDRLHQTFEALLATPVEFQNWADQKKLGARDLAPLLALASVADFVPFLRALIELPVSKSEGVRALELGVELYMLGRPLNDLLPTSDKPGPYLRRLEQWRRPLSAESDESWRQTVAGWPWPAQTQGQWQRFGDQAGLEIKIRASNPQDFLKQLERLSSIRETWSCKS